MLGLNMENLKGFKDFKSLLEDGFLLRTDLPRNQPEEMYGLGTVRIVSRLSTIPDAN